MEEVNQDIEGALTADEQKVVEVSVSNTVLTDQLLSSRLLCGGLSTSSLTSWVSRVGSFFNFMLSVRVISL